MGSKPDDKVYPQIVKLDRALKLAEAWVDKMSGSNMEESADKDIDGRPPRLGLGAKINKHAEVADLNDPIKRKIIQKLGVRNKTPFSRHQEESNKSKVDALDDESDDESESRVNVFSKKRGMTQSTTSAKKKK